jgi:ABC-type transporter Mla subunit MlaD
MADVSITIGAKDEASPTIKRVADNVGEIEKKSGGAAKALGDVAKIASGFVVAQGLMKLPGLLGGAANATSDFNETISKSNTVFKDSAKEIEAWANSAAKGFGQSKTQALEAAGSFGNMFTQLGIGTPVAAKMSQSMVELASDFASFHNADITEVLNAQQAAFRGEYDAVQRFVPTINAAAVETQALAETGKKNAKELTAQEKATVHADAQGRWRCDG